MSTTRLCPLCTKTFGAGARTQDFASHATAVHKFAANFSYVLAPHAAHVALPAAPKDQGDINDFVANNLVDQTSAPSGGSVQASVVPTADIWGASSIGVMESEYADTVISVAGGAGAATKHAVQILVDAVKEANKGDFNITSFIVSICYEFVRHDATENAEVYGDIQLQPIKGHAAFDPPRYISFARWMELWIERQKAVGIGSPTNTYRQLARFLGRDIAKIAAVHPDFKQLAVTGTPVSQKYSIAPSLYLSVLSFFPAIKTVNQWSAAEREAYDCMQANVTKLQSERQADRTTKFVVGAGSVPSSSAAAALMSGAAPLGADNKGRSVYQALLNRNMGIGAGNSP